MRVRVGPLADPHPCGIFDEVREEPGERGLDRGLLRPQHLQAVHQLVAVARQPGGDAAHRVVHRVAPRIRSQPVVRGHPWRHRLQPRRQAGVAFAQDAVDPRGERRQRRVVPMPPVARQAMVEVHVEHDARVTAQRAEARARRDHRVMVVGVAVDAAVADDLRADRFRPVLQRRLPEHEVAQQPAEQRVVGMPRQPGMREVVHAPMVTARERGAGLRAWRRTLAACSPGRACRRRAPRTPGTRPARRSAGCRRGPR